MSITNELVNLRIDLGCDIEQLPDTVGLRYYNDSRDELIDAIIKEKEDYFYNYFDGVLVIGQNEYTLPYRGQESTTPGVYLDGIVTIKGVSVKFKSTDTEFTVLEPHKLENLAYDVTSYNETSTPFYVVMDDSIFIYPTPTEETTYRIHGITYPKALTLSDSDTLPDYITKNIFYGISSRYYNSTHQFNESQIMANKFEEGKLKACKILSGRVETPIQRKAPNLNFLK